MFLKILRYIYLHIDESKSFLMIHCTQLYANTEKTDGIWNSGDQRHVLVLYLINIRTMWTSGRIKTYKRRRSNFDYLLKEKIDKISIILTK